MTEPKQLIAKTKLYNNILRKARIDLGHLSCASLGKAVWPDAGKGVITYVASFENFSMSPVRTAQGGGHEWTDRALELAEFLFMDPEDLWPPEFRKVRNLKPILREISIEEARAIIGKHKMPELISHDPGPEELCLVGEQKQVIENAISTLTPREQFVINRRFGLAGNEEQTLEQIGEQMEISRERVRLIEARAIAKLRGSSRKLKLKDIGTE